MKRGITYGTFNLLHYGHINLLKRAKALGNYLIVALSMDEFNWNKNQKKTSMREYLIDVFVIDDYWREKFNFMKDLYEIAYLEKTLEISTTQIKEDLLK